MRRVLYCILVSILLCSLIPNNTYADAKKKSNKSTESSSSKKKISGGGTIDNDGKEIKNPYGDCKLPKSFADLDYYDCYVPYNLSPKDIGGWSQGSHNASSPVYAQPMTEMAKNWKISAYVNYEGDMNYSYFGSSVKSHEPETGMTIYTDGNGTQYYATAIQHFFYNNSTAGTNGFPGFSVENRGQVFDVILTDGTCIHFVVGDANAIQHTNGGGDDTEGIFDVAYDFTKMLIPQYKHLFQAQAGNCLEVWGTGGCTTKFSAKYNIGSGEDQNRIAYYRMYNGKIANSPKRSSGVGKEVSFSYGNVKIKKGSNDNSVSENTDSTGATIITEWDLIGMPNKTKLVDASNKFNLPNVGDLSIGESYTVSMVRENIELAKKALTYDNARIAVVFVGLCLLLYSLLLFMALLFDKVNQFIEISMVSLATFGALQYSDDDTAKGKRGYASTSKVIIIASVVLIVGIILVSGSVLPWTMELVYRGLEKYM